MQEVIDYYRFADAKPGFGVFLRTRSKFMVQAARRQKLLVRIVAYCLMPTHVHFLLEQTAGNGISEFMCKVMGSYAVYFNKKANRHGPLWDSRFKAKLVETDGYVLQLSRYIHLNPVSAGLVRRPEDWEFSSYREFLSDSGMQRSICEFRKIISFPPQMYRTFVEDGADYQQSLQLMKHLTLD